MMRRLLAACTLTLAFATPALADDHDDRDDDDCGWDDDDDGDDDDAVTCPCFSSAGLDWYLSGWSHYANSWAVRSNGHTDEYSLRGYYWTSWRSLSYSPTIAADVFYDGSQAYCDTWYDIWLAAPYHRFAGWNWGRATPISDAEYDVCYDVLDTWVVDNGVALTSW